LQEDIAVKNWLKAEILEPPEDLPASEFITRFINIVTPIWTEERPLIRQFVVGNSQYLYDVGTNRLFACNNAEYEIINNLANGALNEALSPSRYSLSEREFIINLRHVAGLMVQEGILLTTKIKLRAPLYLEKLVHTSLAQVILETTQRCNLRCRYCIYSPSYGQKRNHGTDDMSYDIASQAIRHLANSCEAREIAALSFYGGEPLLQFGLIKECVSYAKSLFPPNKLAFSMTTNGTLINRDIARYLSDNNFGVHVSIDGPEDIHDENRKFPNGLGSFSCARRGFEYLCEAYADEQRDRLSLSMVYAPPFSESKMEKVASLWNETWLPKRMNFSFSYVQKSVGPDLLATSNADFSALNWAISEYIRNYMADTAPHPLASQFIGKKLALIHQRPICQGEMDEIGLNACCIPGVRKIYVTTNGELQLCERVGLAPSIGDVKSGLDIAKIKALLIDDYLNQSESQCSRCWCARICDICYVQTFYNNEYSAQHRLYYCEMQKTINEIYLRLYCQLLKINPNGLDHLLNMEFV
jgi:uncharacterized protein